MLAAFATDQAEQRLANTKVGCALVVTLMPLGSTADYFVYPDKLAPFFWLRLACSAIAGIIWGLLYTAQGRKLSRGLGVILPVLPVVFLAVMILLTDGFASPYYAALNLVLLAVGAVLHWTLRESIVAVLLVLGLYVGAGVWCGNYPGSDVMFANFYFIALMDIIVVVGTYFQEQARFREFALRFELDKNKQALEAQNAALETANRQIKEAESQLVQAEKLASLGRMSAGIIHEINNPLNFVKTGLYTLRNKGKHLAPEQQADYAEVVKDVEDGFNRVMNIVSSLRGFTHHDDESREEFLISDLVDASLRFVSHEWSVTIRLKKNLLAGQLLHANKNKLIQVCLNLIENSLDALKTKTFPAGEAPTITISSRVENGYNVLSFHDNGTGIAPEHLGKIFDPFFTTKDVGAGMGMGLSISHRIVESYGGRIRVQSEPGRFCEFTLEFPVQG